MGDVKEFYDNWTEKFLKDYLFGNRRTENTINYAIKEISAHDSDILEIGCGIGWSSYEIASHFPKAQVTAIDLSKESIKMANALFSKGNITFKPMNVHELSDDLIKKYDVIVMLDVYEHISKQMRSTLHKSLNDLLASNGKIILTCPSIYHQRFLQKNHPEGLQPIDEEVTLDDLLTLANRLDSILSSYILKNISHRFDYIHASISRSMIYEPISITRNIYPNLESKISRLLRLEDSKYAKSYSSLIEKAKSRYRFRYKYFKLKSYFQ